MKNVTDRVRDPFDISPPCKRFVPGYGDANADFHVVGDHPGVHGGLEARIPFTGKPWSADFFEALAAAGLVESLRDGELEVGHTYFSYLHACDAGEEGPTDADYAELDRFFDAELRAITAHVLLPVGERATAHVLSTYTAKGNAFDRGMDALHGTEIRGAGWLVVPMKDPATWESGDADRLVTALLELQQTDFRQTTDLGRFVANEGTYFVR
ncbi:uracil-DNA glycosylase family protein [Halobacteriales archaeon Cl-PHB]